MTPNSPQEEPCYPKKQTSVKDAKVEQFTPKTHDSKQPIFSVVQDKQSSVSSLKSENMICDGINLNLKVDSQSHNLNNAIAQTVILRDELTNNNGKGNKIT